MALIASHVQRAATVGKIVDLQAVSSADLVEAFDCLAAAVFLVEAAGAIRFMNTAGRRLLDDGRIFSADRGRLSIADRATDRMLRDAIARAGGGDQSRGTEFVATPFSTGAEQGWIAHVLPLVSGRRPETLVGTGATAAVFVCKVELDTKLPMEIIKKTCNLTPSELRVLDAILAVGQIAAAAELLGLSQATVKTHLHHLYQKTGMQRRADLVRLVASVASPFVA